MGNGICVAHEKGEGGAASRGQRIEEDLDYRWQIEK
jgi:hypothetical protein